MTTYPEKDDTTQESQSGQNEIRTKFLSNLVSLKELGFQSQHICEALVAKQNDKVQALEFLIRER
jgi:Holliday junction resolvasome RuvABC DNA-binding subunit